MNDEIMPCVQCPVSRVKKHSGRPVLALTRDTGHWTRDKWPPASPTDTWAKRIKPLDVGHRTLDTGQMAAGLAHDSLVLGLWTSASSIVRLHP